MNKAWPEEVKKLFEQYQAREEKIKKAWLEKYPEKMLRGTIAGAEIKALWKEFATEAKAIETKYSPET